jgi:hypothetical protein
LIASFAGEFTGLTMMMAASIALRIRKGSFRKISLEFALSKML